MAARKPKLELYWSPAHPVLAPKGGIPIPPNYEVNWRLVAANGEVLCQCTQGFQDKTDAMRNVEAVAEIFGGVGSVNWEQRAGLLRIVGPGKKPQGAKA